VGPEPGAEPSCSGPGDSSFSASFGRASWFDPPVAVARGRFFLEECAVTPEFDQRFRTVAHTALRIAAGLTYFSHGGQKLFGWFGGLGPQGGHAELMSRFGAAGTIEVVAGVCIVLGLFTRPVAFIASGEMAVAYFWMHVGGSGKLWWWLNRGEVV